MEEFHVTRVVESERNPGLAATYPQRPELTVAATEAKHRSRGVISHSVCGLFLKEGPLAIHVLEKRDPNQKLKRRSYPKGDLRLGHFRTCILNYDA